MTASDSSRHSDSAKRADVVPSDIQTPPWPPLPIAVTCEAEGFALPEVNFRSSRSYATLVRWTLFEASVFLNSRPELTDLSCRVRSSIFLFLDATSDCSLLT
ncbi:MAG: hypothetical protein BJ554DRAFT_3510 [Olpidium bornovanus]|uniref:Uncharacterized protein n=1 Tax=Olpidium bornovanus TaxID=278681 RepID=A0A8H8DFL9_9FUNG|nr:MAG: hypothetical protein BJ554DRAFT_3510 [Olpidium bornovanus]